MHLTVKGKQLDVGDALRTHASEVLQAIVEKYFNDPIEANVVISRDAHLFTADISVHVGRNILLQSSAEATEPYPAFDAAAERLAKRLRRHKRRLRGRHRDGQAAAASLPAMNYILDVGAPDDQADDGRPEPSEAGAGTDGEDDRAQPVVVAVLATTIDTLTVSEAVMRMDLADLPALMFRNRGHGGLNMVYRRPDGNVGWVDPKGSQGTGA
jgi:ribosomal subunit interface protein